MRANVTLPEVQQIHVVDCCLAPLYLKKNSRITDTTKVVRSKRKFIAGEKADLFVLKSKFPSEIPERILHCGAATARLISFGDACRRFWRFQVIAKAVRKHRHLDPIRRAFKLLLNELLEADRHR